jgi:hypothetical protein
MEAEIIATNFSKVFKELQELRARLDQIECSSSSSNTQQTHKLQQSQVKKPAAPHFNQRTGNYSSEDVSIEKFFYAGQR